MKPAGDTFALVMAFFLSNLDADPNPIPEEIPSASGKEIAVSLSSRTTVPLLLAFVPLMARAVGEGNADKS